MNPYTEESFQKFISQLIPEAPVTSFNDRGGGRGRQRFIFYSPKNHNFRICLPKKITTFLSYPKKSLSSFFATQENPSVCFCDPKKSQRLSYTQKKSLLAKISDPKESLGPAVTKICEWGPWAIDTSLEVAMVKHIQLCTTSINSR